LSPNAFLLIFYDATNYSENAYKCLKEWAVKKNVNYDSLKKCFKMMLAKDREKKKQHYIEHKVRKKLKNDVGLDNSRLLTYEQEAAIVTMLRPKMI